MSIKCARRRPVAMLCGLWAWLFISGQAIAQPEKFDRALQQTQKTVDEAKSSQRKIDQLDGETATMLQRYRSALLETQQANQYAQQIEALAAAQGDAQKALERQLIGIDDTERKLLPLSLKMVTTLEEFVARDLPFLVAERRERIASLKTLMADPASGAGEKFRRVLEAYQIEDDYGRSLGVERGEHDGKTYEMLRVGRTMLFAVSPDGRSAEQWDNLARRWQALPRRYLAELRQALKMARGSAAIDLLLLPAPTARKTP